MSMDVYGRGYVCAWYVFDKKGVCAAVVSAYTNEEASNKCSRAFGFRDLDDALENYPGKCYNDSDIFLRDVIDGAAEHGMTEEDIMERHKELPIQQYRDFFFCPDYFGSFCETYKMFDVLDDCMFYPTIAELRHIEGFKKESEGKFWHCWCSDWTDEMEKEFVDRYTKAKSK